MAPKKEDGRTRRKTSAEGSDSEPVGRTVEKAAGQARDVTMVDVDPWGSFFERFWEQAGGEDAGRPEPATGVRTPGAKPARRGRPPRAP